MFRDGAEDGPSTGHADGAQLALHILAFWVSKGPDEKRERRGGRDEGDNEQILFVV